MLGRAIGRRYRTRGQGYRESVGAGGGREGDEREESRDDGELLGWEQRERGQSEPAGMKDSSAIVRPKRDG